MISATITEISHRAIEAAATTLSILLPAVILLLFVWLFRNKLKQLLSDLGIKSFGAFGVNAQLEIAQIRKVKIDFPAGISKQLELAFDSLAPLVENKSILWIDDKPSNNRREVRVLNSLSVFVTQVTSLECAITSFDSEKYDLVISDWNRKGPDGEIAIGPHVVKTLRDRHIKAPLIFYTGSNKYRGCAEKLGEKYNGIIGLTYDPDELFRWIFAVLTAKRLGALA